VEAFSETLNAEFDEGELVEWERDFLEKNIEEFESDDWIYKVRRPRKDDRILYSVYKAPGGLIRTSLILDDAHGVIKYVMLTGDFFAYPNRSVLDLEAALKSCRANKAADTIREFFRDKKPDMPGVTAEDFVNAIEAALKKRDLTKLGLSPKEANTIHAINDALDHLDEMTVVLLPYCAKMADCELRYDEDCLECGGCTVGVAYELARRNNMEPVTIVSFEHLWEVLQEMKKRGVKSYLGCCCEPFFAKHREDFERAGIAGILVDIENTSCYELDQEKEAKLGIFKEETKLNVELLKKLFEERTVSAEKAEETLVENARSEDIKTMKDKRRSLYADKEEQGE
jgi:lipoate-protein ligase A